MVAPVRVSSILGEPAAVIREYIRRKIAYACEHPNTVRLFSIEVGRRAPVLCKHWRRSHDAADKARGIVQEWIDKGLIRKTDPMLFQIHLWAVTQHYADYEAQVRFMLNLEEGAPLDQEHIVNEISEMFLRHCGLAS